MDVGSKSLLIGIAIGVVGAFGTGFLKKAGEDLYLLIKNTIYPPKEPEKHSQLVIHMHDPAPNNSENTDLVEIEKISSVSFYDIERAIENAPPLQREDVAKNYIGINVAWDTHLRSAYKCDDGNISLRLAIGETYMGRSVLCEVSESEYKELGVLPEGTKIRVFGQIKEADRFDMRLSDVRLQIYPENSKA